MTDIGIASPGEEAGSRSSAVRVWDPLVRIFHWSLVAAFATAWLTAEELQPVHELAGYAVAGLLAVRVLWGFFGTRYARFAQFVRGPRATARYMSDVTAGRERRYLGHNPAGAAMIVAILLPLSGTALTGWLMEEPARDSDLSGRARMAPPAFAKDDAAAGPLKEIHEVLANLMLVLAALHIGGVALASYRHRENLARAMVTGRKRAAGPGDVA